MFCGRIKIILHHSSIMLPEVITRTSPSTQGIRTQLEAELRAWWEEEQEDWDAQITGDTPDSDLWTGMPCVDSKTVARMAPIFEKHLGRFRVRDIRPGGYDSIDDVIQHLVHRK